MFCICNRNHVILIYALSAASRLTGMTGYTDRLRQTLIHTLPGVSKNFQYTLTGCNCMTMHDNPVATCSATRLHVQSKILLIPYIS